LSLARRTQELRRLLEQEASAVATVPALGAQAGSGPENAAPAAQAPAKDKPTCPSGQAPRMVFGKWKCGPATEKPKSSEKPLKKSRKKKKKKTPKKLGFIAKAIRQIHKVLNMEVSDRRTCTMLHILEKNQ
jgi:hypothetical protein